MRPIQHFFSWIPLDLAGLFLCCFLFKSLEMQGQETRYKVSAIGFYNVENLFDTVNDTLINDEEFLPGGTKQWTPEKYADKLRNMSDVISKLGTEMSPDGLAILGLGEVENKKVIEDLVSQAALKDRHYQIVHYNSPDFRGIDVGLIYQSKYFRLIHSEAIPFEYFDEGKPIRSRDILYVKGLMDGDTLHVFVSHWPSRRGGEAATVDLREQAAATIRKKVDEIYQDDGMAKIVIMGDLNDDPRCPSLRTILKAKPKEQETGVRELFNTSYPLYKSGQGTLGFNGSWTIFDQIIVSHGLLNQSKTGGFHLYQSRIFKEPFLIQKMGTFKGYPYRTFDGDLYMGGYSDHLPVYILLLKPAS